jgi:hypothetical protein
LNAPARALSTIDDGAGPALFAGGAFSGAGALAARGIARWDGARWSALDVGIEGRVDALAAHDDGSGTALYAGGSFFAAGGVFAESIARWDGARWSALGSGIHGGAAPVRALASFGGALYAGGDFTLAGGMLANRIAAWDGLAWSVPGGGVDLSGTIEALATFDDGDGARLVASGTFDSIGGVAGAHVAQWDGSAWSPLGAGLDAPALALAVYDAGSGRAELYAGGAFTLAGGVAVQGIARWDGTSWAAVGDAVGAPGGSVRALAVHDDGLGHGAALYASGTFTALGSASTAGLARWDGAQWSAVAGGSAALALAVYDDGAGAALYLGGNAASPPGVASTNLAALRGCDAPGRAFCFGDGSGTPCPCGNHGTAGAGCASSVGSGAVLAASGTPSVQADTLVLHGSGMPPDSLSLYLQGLAPHASGLGSAFGDGLRCVGGSLARLGVAQCVNGASSYPSLGDAPVSLQASAPPGVTRTYQIWYRDPASFCSAATFNLSNGLQLHWLP